MILVIKNNDQKISVSINEKKKQFWLVQNSMVCKRNKIHHYTKTNLFI